VVDLEEVDGRLFGKEKKSERARGLLLVLSAGRALEGLAARG
jgi:hypothetical protein